MPQIQNEFSYSFSRYNTFKKCRKQYFLNYYGSWGGWNSGATKEARDTYWLKKLTGMWAWTGNIVHKEIELIFNDIRDGQLVHLDKSIDRARREMTRQFKISKNRRTASLFGLKQHEYGLEVPRERLRNRVITALTNFFFSGMIEIYQALEPEDILSIEGISKFPIEYEDFTINVYSVPDFAYRQGDEVIIYDWKTGNPSDSYTDQVALYSLYANSYWDVDPENVETNILYLKTGDNVQKRATKKWIEEARQRVHDESLEMMEYIESIDSNKLKKDVEFPLTEDRDACKWCNFERVCGIRGGQGGSSQAMGV